MIKTLYAKHPFFFNLLIFNLFWNTIRIIQWNEVQPERLSFIIKYIAIEFFIVMVISVLMIRIYSWADTRKELFVHITLLVIFMVISPVLLFTLSYIIKDIIWPAGIFYKFSFKELRSSFFFFSMFFIGLIGIIYITRFRINFVRQKEATRKAETLAKETQLKMLRYQINPHFLFNILNSLHALVDENRDLAKKLIINLSEYYRSTLDKQLQKHTIEHEISIIKKYFEIQKIRFEENLEYEIQVDDNAKKIQIPSFIIHLLIENAIKYGLKYIEDKLIIKLNITLNKKTLAISVINSGKLKNNHINTDILYEGTGSGIDNITSRLKLFFEDDYTFSISEEDNWVKAKIDIYVNRL